MNSDNSNDPPVRRSPFGGVVHTYQKFDPAQFPSPTSPPPDMVSSAFEHLLFYGSTRHLSEEELARAVKIDPSQIKGFGPSLQAIQAMLEERKRKILQTYETDTVQSKAQQDFHQKSVDMVPPPQHQEQYRRAIAQQQLYDLEQIWYQAGGEKNPFSRKLLPIMDALGTKYQIDELASKYDFTGKQSLTIPKALEIKEELEKIDELLKQLQEAEQSGQIAVIDMEELADFVESADMERLQSLQQQIDDYLKEMARQQGVEQTKDGYQLSPKAYKLFQGKLLEQIFSHIQAGRSGRHQGPIAQEGAVEVPQTKPYEFGDSVAQMDIPSSLINAMIRQGSSKPLQMRSEDIVIHKTRNVTKCATVVLLDMSGSMRYNAEYVNVKRMGLALDGLIRSEYPGDYLQFLEMYTFAKPRRSVELVELMPKPVTIYDPIVRLTADMSDPDVSELHIPPHFTNIQHGLRLSRQFLSLQDTPNRQVIIITDGLPTAHFEDEHLFLLYPPDPRTEKATLNEGVRCAREGITINLFLMSAWNQTEEDVKFAYNLAESTKGRVFFTAGENLDRYVVWDYVERKRSIIN